MNGIAAAGRHVIVSGVSPDAHPWNLGGPAPSTVIIDSHRAERHSDREQRTRCLPAGVS
ncbi:hypothetical protein AB0C61_27385 [Streptomyces sp. NPDC048680]|uniref:hypothetical protein n=1 Tax=Streptomyces sp. NPDC048680 TaxID=3155492 RepID=UPI00343CAD0A